MPRTLRLQAGLKSRDTSFRKPVLPAGITDRPVGERIGVAVKAWPGGSPSSAARLCGDRNGAPGGTQRCLETGSFGNSRITPTQ